jgi:6,7-dimethyl-8-ribityllumazine synthase
MSNAISVRPRGVTGSRRRFVIVASEFNGEYVQGLIDHATEELRALSSGCEVKVHHVPGAFEIPIVVQELALRKSGAAILAVGVILKGKTDHAEHLARTVTDGLQRIALEQGVPIINAVLSVNTEIEARERCLEDRINRGSEAARAAVSIANLMEELREKGPTGAGFTARRG